MTTPAIRNALERLIGLEDAASTNGADPDTTVWDDAVAAGRAALKAAPEREGPSLAGLLPAEPPNIPTTMAMQYRSAWREGVEDGWNEARAILAGLERLATPPAPEVGELPSDELMGQWKEECKRLSLESDYAIPASSFMAQRVIAWARQQQATELAALQGVPVAGASDEHRDAVCTAIAESLGNAYDCQRVWSAWSHGTMGPDDFTLTAEDDDRVAEIADAVIEAFRTVQVPVPRAGEGEGRTMAEDALVALERIQHGDASHGSDDFDLVANALGQLRRYDAPPAPQAGEGEA